MMRGRNFDIDERDAEFIRLLEEFYSDE